MTSGNYIAITSELDAGPEIRSARLRFVPISDTDMFRQRFAAISNPQMPASSALRKVIATTVEILETQEGVP